MKQIYEPILEFGISKYIKTSHYGVHYDTAIKIYNDNKYFGIGLKQFRNESGKEIYDKMKITYISEIIGQRIPIKYILKF